MKLYVIFALAAAALIGTIVVTQWSSDGQNAQNALEPAVRQRPGAPGPNTVAGKIVETMNAGGYTYVLVDDGRNRIWAAGPETKIKVGDDVTFERGMHMNGFRSETLNRTFDRIYFVSSLRPGAADGAVPEGHPPVTSTSHNAMPDIDFSDIEVPEHGRRIADVYAHRAGLAGQTVMVRGRVVKYTGGVMGKNWIHIMDGSGDEGTNNLTVTTDVVARIGDTVLINGTLAIDKDFGFGYEYDVIVEDASVTVETAY